MWRSNMKLTLVCILFFSLHVHMIDVGPTCKEKMSYWTFKWSNSARVHIYKCNILVIYVNISALIVWWYVFPPPFFSLQLSQIHLALEGTILWLFSLPSHPNWIKLKPSSLAPPSLWNLLILCENCLKHGWYRTDIGTSLIVSMMRTEDNVASFFIYHSICSHNNVSWDQILRFASQQ